ncbi:hypothetical protein ACVJGD_001868 [Bradyrhizobium sp. USDA 10063]
MIKVKCSNACKQNVAQTLAAPPCFACPPNP